MTQLAVIVSNRETEPSMRSRAVSDTVIEEGPPALPGLAARIQPPMLQIQTRCAPIPISVRSTSRPLATSSRFKVRSVWTWTQPTFLERISMSETDVHAPGFTSLFVLRSKALCF